MCPIKCTQKSVRFVPLQAGLILKLHPTKCAVNSAGRVDLSSEKFFIAFASGSLCQLTIEKSASRTGLVPGKTVATAPAHNLSSYNHIKQALAIVKWIGVFVCIYWCTCCKNLLCLTSNCWVNWCLPLPLLHLALKFALPHNKNNSLSSKATHHQYSHSHCFSAGCSESCQAHRLAEL